MMMTSDTGEAGILADLIDARQGDLDWSEVDMGKALDLADEGYLTADDVEALVAVNPEFHVHDGRYDRVHSERGLHVYRQKDWSAITIVTQGDQVMVSETHPY